MLWGTAAAAMRQLATAAALLLGVTLATYLLLFSIGDVASSIAPESVGQEQIEALRTKYGLDRPVLTQYWDWLSGVARGDLGVSFRSTRSVSDLLGQRLEATASLALVSLVISLLAAIPLAVIGARHPNLLADRVTRFASVIALSIPNFFLGLLLVLIFAVRFDLLPATGYQPISEGVRRWLTGLILPGLTLGLSLAGEQARTLRASLGSQLAMDYVRTARAKGVRELGVVVNHVGRNSLAPLVTVIGLQLGRLLGGTVLVETVFGLPGLGSLTVTSVFARDLPVVQALVLFTAAMVIAASLLVDLSYHWLRPAVRGSS